MLAVPYFEKRLYELADDEVTPERLVQLASDIEVDIQGILYSSLATNTIVKLLLYLYLSFVNCLYYSWMYFLPAIDCSCLFTFLINASRYFLQAIGLRDLC